MKKIFTQNLAKNKLTNKLIYIYISTDKNIHLILWKSTVNTFIFSCF